MTPTARIAFGVIAFAILSGLVWLCVKEDAAAAKLVAAAPTLETPAPQAAAAATPGVASRKSDLPPPIPFNQLTRVAREENRIIYTTSALGEPLEVHPDGSQVIRGHRQVLKYPDGREEVRFTTVRMAPPQIVPASEVMIDPEMAGAATRPK